MTWIRQEWMKTDCKEALAGIHLSSEERFNHSARSGVGKNWTHLKDHVNVYGLVLNFLFCSVHSQLYFFLSPDTLDKVFSFIVTFGTRNIGNFKIQIPNQSQTSSVPLSSVLTRLWIWSRNDIWSCLSSSSGFGTSFGVEAVNLVWLGDKHFLHSLFRIYSISI